jgi:hypothetical protein
MSSVARNFALYGTRKYEVLIVEWSIRREGSALEIVTVEYSEMQNLLLEPALSPFRCQTAECVNPVCGLPSKSRIGFFFLDRTRQVA